MIDLLAVLRCLRCGGQFSRSGLRLTCISCGRQVPIVDGFPRFAPEFDLGFDTRWRAHPRPQATTESVFVDKIGWTREDLEGRTVLDAGAGAGRFSALVAGLGAEVLAVDASPSALRAAACNAPGATLVQADLLTLPLVDGCVDLAFSIGVLHHTADPARAFREVARTVRPGGRLAVWLYPDYFGDERKRAAAAFLHEITRACPPEALHRACERHAVGLRDLYGETDDALSTVLAVSRSADADECVSDTFDWHVPTYRSAHTFEELEGWFQEAGFHDVCRRPFPVAVTGRRKR